LSTRQTQRVHAAAVAAVAATLGEAGWAEDGGEPREADPPPTEAANPPLEALLDDEIAAILARDHAEEESLPAIIRSAIQTITPMLEARGASIELATDDALATRVAPYDLVRPAIVQLLLAALDHAQPRALSVAAALDGAGVVMRLATASREVRGDGADAAADLERRLGVARRLLGAIGGTVAIELAPVFRIEARLPAGIAPTVLVVEDNPQVVQLFRRYLSGSPYQMLSAATGGAALDLASAERPDAITLDLLLPQRDGWEFLQAAKVHPATRGIPVIVCSVLQERELALSLGAADFLAKPVTQHALLTALRQHLRRSPPADLAPSPAC
jgi:CheY-like chemotaxis protein